MDVYNDFQNMVRSDNLAYVIDRFHLRKGRECIDYDTKILVNDSLEVLNEDEKQVIDMRYFKDYTQQETADALGINQVKVSRLETSSKKKIKK